VWRKASLRAGTYWGDQTRPWLQHGIGNIALYPIEKGTFIVAAKFTLLDVLSGQYHPDDVYDRIQFHVILYDAIVEF
jgi:hypothetical protein